MRKQEEVDTMGSTAPDNEEEAYKGRWRMGSTGLEPHPDGEWVLFREVITIQPQHCQQIVDLVMHQIALRRGSSTRRDFEVARLTIEAMKAAL